MNRRRRWDPVTETYDTYDFPATFHDGPTSHDEGAERLERSRMSKAEEFEKIAKSASLGEWCKDSVYWALRAFDKQGMDCMNETCHEDELRHPRGDADAKFIVWCANNRDLIARALQIDEKLHTPVSHFTSDRMSEAFMQHLADEWPEAHEALANAEPITPRAISSAIAAAVREAVK